jgi:hypothetical protein
MELGRNKKFVFALSAPRADSKKRSPVYGSQDQSLCFVSFFFISGANSPMLLVKTPTQACVIAL